MFVDVKATLSRPVVPKSICLVLVLLLIWQVYANVSSFFMRNKTMIATHEHVSDLKNKIKPNVLASGLKAAFFGDYVPKNIDNAEVKQSMLDLKIVGIMFSPNGKASHVIIRTASGREQSFRVGDSLPGGAVIKRITPDGVLIGHNGGLERLTLPEKPLTFEPPPEPLGFSD